MLETESYLTQEAHWPQSGQHILAQFDEHGVVVYQAYRSEIGHFAAKNQFFGGEFKLSRMSWIKPNFLWMMYRCGWGAKADQEVVLAITLRRDAFTSILEQAVHSTYLSAIYGTHDEWKKRLAASSVRLQWDPDHDPYGIKQERRAIQLGLVGDVLRAYSREWILKIEDISDFVAEQREHVSRRDISHLVTPREEVYPIDNDRVSQHLGVSEVPDEKAKEVMSKNDIRHSKFLSLVLRHEPEKIGITLDPQGWVDVDVLLDALGRHGHGMDFAHLERLVRENEKQRFALSEDGTRIRANQGHSVEVDLALTPQTPPEVLYHGTVDRFLQSIRATGLEKRDRHHVHLSEEAGTAEKVGQRRGKPVLLNVQAGEMHRAGHRFFVSDNGVWLVDHIPTEFIVFPAAPMSANHALSAKGVATLFRPTGLKELELIHHSGMKTFPPRLPEQPIFYPVMNQEYAQQIARDWNAKSEPDQIGFVLRFDVEADYLARFPVQTVGAKRHQELWVPAEELDEFNHHIVGLISITDVYRDEACTLDLDDQLRIPTAWLLPT